MVEPSLASKFLDSHIILPIARNKGVHHHPDFSVIFKGISKDSFLEISL